MTLSTIRASNASRAFASHPVGVFVGGTSGIGRGMAEAFAHHTNGKSSIYLVGRNRDGAKAILDSLPAPPSAEYKREFVQCDMTLMKNVHAASLEILTKTPKINYLVISAGFMSMEGRTPTEEGIDKKLAVHYYGRWRFIHDLIPALNQAKEAGEEAKVMSVMAPGKGGEVDAEDFGLEKNYSVARAALVAPTYNDLMVESFSSLHPSLSFVHAHPGIVRTPLLSASNSRLLNVFGYVANYLLYPISTSEAETGEYMWHALYNVKEGAARSGSRGEDLGKKRYFGTDEQREKLWEHTVKMTHVEEN